MTRTSRKNADAANCIASPSPWMQRHSTSTLQKSPLLFHHPSEKKNLSLLFLKIFLISSQNICNQSDNKSQYLFVCSLETQQNITSIRIFSAHSVLFNYTPTIALRIRWKHLLLCVPVRLGTLSFLYWVSFQLSDWLIVLGNIQFAWIMWIFNLLVSGYVSFCLLMFILFESGECGSFSIMSWQPTVLFLWNLWVWSFYTLFHVFLHSNANPVYPCCI